MNLSGFTKAELIQMAIQHCKHKHSYLTHPNCYITEKRGKKKIGYFDIESGGLTANFDYMLTWVIKTRDKEEYREGCISVLDINNYTLDKRILKELPAALISTRIESSVP